ncbi:hypothetical protein H0H87_007975 [Tephrocybe sp. NHM501043]|nr:hypothetical protein H0H87_007975 [Tephrocybe sp. NHM501043]
MVLFLYTLTLLIFSLIGQSRGNAVWRSSVSEAIFFETKQNEAYLQPAGATVYLNTGAYISPSPMQQYPAAQQYTTPPPPNNGLPQV